MRAACAPAEARHVCEPSCCECGGEHCCCGRERSDWTTMRRQDFDTAVPLSLFDPAPTMRLSRPAPDPHGTPDLFDAPEEGTA